MTVTREERDKFYAHLAKRDVDTIYTSAILRSNEIKESIRKRYKDKQE